jgi:hypothetical protein
MKTEDVKPGDILYVNSSCYIDHGEDDVAGGKATVKRVLKPGENPYVYYPAVEFHGLPGRYYNLESILKDQSKLERTFKDKLAHEDPDYG